jgi:hypothetical protein
MAVSHVWDCLEKPWGLRCALMAGSQRTSGRCPRAGSSWVLGHTVVEWAGRNLAKVGVEGWNRICPQAFLVHRDSANAR